MDWINALHDRGIIAVIRDFEVRQTSNLVAALHQGGVSVIEFTLTNPEAIQAIQIATRYFKDTCLIGAGSVTQPEQIDMVVQAGATFVVTPIVKPAVIQYAQQHNIPIIAGAYTPTEIYTAHELGADAIKVFPATSLGASYLKDVLAPLPNLKLIPTGGITVTNLGEYIQAGAWAIGLGSSLISKTALAKHDWTALTNLAQAASEQWQQRKGQ